MSFDVTKPMQIGIDPRSHGGPEDGRFRFGVAYDDDYLYVALRVLDDKTVLDPGVFPWQQDGVEIRLDLRDEEARAADPVGREFDTILLAAASPARAAGDDAVYFQRENLPEGTQFTIVRTDDGHVTELAVPMTHAREQQGGELRSFRLNIAVDDFDAPNQGAQLWWRPDWRTNESYPGSGTFHCE